MIALICAQVSGFGALWAGEQAFICTFEREILARGRAYPKASMLTQGSPHVSMFPGCARPSWPTPENAAEVDERFLCADHIALDRCG